MVDLAECVVLVTGAGGGLGNAICRSLGSVGARIVAADVRPEAAAAIAEHLQSAGGKAMALFLDVKDELQAFETIQRTVATFSRLDVLINNAGVDVTAPFSEISVAEWDNILGVNLRGPFLMAKAAFPIMRQQGRGHIVNIVSTAAKRTWANASAYHASKWGLLGFSHALHVEGRSCNIKVTAVVSGGMRTPFLLDRFPDIDPGVLQDPANVAETVKFVLTQPDETVIPEVLVLPMRESSWP